MSGYFGNEMLVVGNIQMFTAAQFVAYFSRQVRPAKADNSRWEKAMQSGCIEVIDMRISRAKFSTSDHSALFLAVVDSIGTACFADHLLSFLDRAMGGVDHCALYMLDGASPSKLGAASLAGLDHCDRAMNVYLAGHWHSDPLMQKIRGLPRHRRPNLTRMNVERLSPSGLRDLVFRKINVTDRLMLSGAGAGERIGCSMLRSARRGMMPDNQIDALVGLADLVVTLVAKHAELIALRDNLIKAVTSPSEIAAAMSNATEQLTRQEIEVCARTLCGLSAHSISVELNIAEESVRTYRKRAYHRIGISSARELLIWYLGTCGNEQILGRNADKRYRTQN